MYHRKYFKWIGGTRVPMLGSHLVDKSRTAFYRCDVYLNFSPKFPWLVHSLPFYYFTSKQSIQKKKNYNKLTTNTTLMVEDISIVSSSNLNWNSQFWQLDLYEELNQPGRCNNFKTNEYLIRNTLTTQAMHV